MMKSMTVAVCLCLLVFGINRSIEAQGRVVRSSISAESSNREQDGLNGPVRRLRVETAEILVKDGKTVEAPHVLREISTYDPKGRKIDSVAYPAESTTLPGKEQYQYDNKGNIVQMVLRGDDGSILSKEKYDYEFDEFGNWKKMTSSVAVYESGKVSYEPVELTYRMISYYYNEAIDKLAKSLSKSNDSSGSASRAEPLPTKPTAVTPAPGSPTESKTAIKDEAVSSRVDPKVNKGESKDATSLAPAQRGSSAIQDSPIATTVAAPSGSSNKAIPIKSVSEEVLRSAVVELPQPEYPQAAMLARVEGNVEVRVLVDEQGNVMSARAMSGSPLLIDAAETAARKARFSKARLSLDSARVYSVIKYTFTIPASEVSSAPSSNDSAVEHKNVKLDEGTPVSKIVKQPEGIVKQPEGSSAAEQSPPTSGSDPAISFYKKGLSYLALGRPAEAVDALKQVVQLDPNDAIAYAKLGLAYSGLHQYKETVTVLKMAIRINREVVDAEAYYQLGQAYIALGKHSEALEAFKQALYITRAQAIDPGTKVQSFPSLEDIHYSLALTYHNKGRYSEAINELHQVIAMNPKFAEAYYGLVMSYVALGDRKSAEKQQKILSSLNPALGEKAANAFSLPSPILPPGVNRGRP
jgi:TonB family protein